VHRDWIVSCHPNFQGVDPFEAIFRPRPLAFVLQAARSSGAIATVRARSLPSGGKLGRRNWRLRSLKDTQFHSTPEMSGAGSDGQFMTGFIQQTLKGNAVLSEAALQFWGQDLHNFL
jgi:hypothetical protein